MAVMLPFLPPKKSNSQINWWEVAGLIQEVAPELEPIIQEQEASEQSRMYHGIPPEKDSNFNHNKHNSVIFTTFSDKFTKDPDPIIDYTKLHASPETDYSSEIPHHLRQVIQHISELPFSKETNRKVLDLTAHVGGFSLPWATIYPQDQVYAVEMNTNNFANLKYNIKALGLSNVHPVHYDAVKLLWHTSKEAMNQIMEYSLSLPFTFIYLDPPWGGPMYRKIRPLQLFLGQRKLPDILEQIFSRKLTDWIVLKVPTNYDFQHLPFKYTVYSITSPNIDKSYPDYLLVIIQRVHKLSSTKDASHSEKNNVQ
jgi:16S rRNA G966 N2-methylase RsmD